MNSPFTYRDLLTSLPAHALDQPVRIFLRDVGTWTGMETAGPVTEIDCQGDLNELPGDAWVLSSR